MMKEKIYVIDIEFPNNFNAECFEDLDTVDDQQAVADFDAFCDNAYSVLRRHGFDVFDDKDSDNEGSLSQYLITFKGEDFEASNIKVIVFIRLSDHRLGRQSYKRRARQNYYDALAQEIKMPINKEHQDWEFINIVANGNEVKDYRGALNSLNDRLDDIEEQYYSINEDYESNDMSGESKIVKSSLYNGDEFDIPEDYSIEYWYDRYTRSWVVQVFDSNHYEVDCSYVGNKEDRDYEIDRFKNEYNTDKVTKWRG